MEELLHKVEGDAYDRTERKRRDDLNYGVNDY